MAKSIAIVGMGRSGTTFLADALKKNGVFFGHVSNLNENNHFRAINDTILAQECKATIGTLPYGEIDLLKNLTIPNQWYEKAKGLANNYNQTADSLGAKYWCFKDPRTTLLFDIWDESVDICIAVFRYPNEVVNSYIYHDFITVENRKKVLEDYWTIYNRNLLKITENKKTYFFNFNSDINTQIQTILQKLELPCNVIPYQSSMKNINNNIEFATSEIEEIYNEILKRSNND